MCENEMIFHFSWSVLVRSLFSFGVQCMHTNSALRTYHFVCGVKITTARSLIHFGFSELQCMYVYASVALIWDFFITEVLCVWFFLSISNNVDAEILFCFHSFLIFFFFWRPSLQHHSHSTTLNNEMYLFGECPLGFLLFRRFSKQATLSANACNVFIFSS